MPMSSPFPTAGPETVDHALLLATLPSLATPYFLSPIITAAVSATRERLIIILFSRFFNASHSFNSQQRILHTDPERWNEVQRLLTHVYVQATKVAQELDKILLEVDVLLKGMDEDVPGDLGSGLDIVFRVNGDSIAVPLPPSITALRHAYMRAGEPPSQPVTPPPELAVSPMTPLAAVTTTPSSRPPFYPVVALGGTFDHLHAGHKILLSMGAWITSEKLIVGVTDDTLLQNKSNHEILQHLETRIANVRSFLQLFKTGLTYDIVPINDVYGPTGYDANIQALVVSKETLSGAASIAAHRKAQSLPPLETFVIDVISSTSSSVDHENMETLKNAKMSSTFIREWIVKNGTGKT